MVKTLLNQPEHVIRRSIDEFFDQKKPDDLLVMYFSGHGVRDELGALYLAVKDTDRSYLRSTAIKSDFVREAMDQSRSRRQVLILDCCNSGAFGQGTKAATGVSIGTSTAFESGYGRIILTASDSTQFAWEGDRVIGETQNSLFTHYLVEGLKGPADRNGDGQITVDELYDYAYEKVKLATPKQTPSKFSSKQQGEIVFRKNISIEDTIPLPLPNDLAAAISSSLPYIREGAVQQLDQLVKGKNLGLARSARLALEKIAEEDDSRRVALLATQALQTIRKAEQLSKQKDGEDQENRANETAKPIAIQESGHQTPLIERANVVELQDQAKSGPIPTRMAEEKQPILQVPAPSIVSNMTPGSVSTQSDGSSIQTRRQPLLFPPAAISAWRLIRSFFNFKNKIFRGLLTTAIVLILSSIVINFAASLGILVIDPPTVITTYKVSNLRTTTSPNAAEATSNFSKGQDIFVPFELTNVAAGTTLEARWYYRVNIFGKRVNILFTSVVYIVEANDTKVYFFLKQPETLGDYQVDIYMDKVLVGRRALAVK